MQIQITKDLIIKLNEADALDLRNICAEFMAHTMEEAHAAQVPERLQRRRNIASSIIDFYDENL